MQVTAVIVLSKSSSVLDDTDNRLGEVLPTSENSLRFTPA